MSESVAQKVDLALDHVESQKHVSSLSTGSSSLEKGVSACTGAIITMSFSKWVGSRGAALDKQIQLIPNP
jgi:hypothetical protein